jgi:serine/threonine protein kinase
MYVVDLSIFEEWREIEFAKSGSGCEVSLKRYSRRSDGFEVVVKSFPSFDRDTVDKILNEFVLLTQLKHRCIAPLIGFVLPTDSTPLKTATMYYGCGSLRDVQMNNPVWWTSTTKSKAIAGIALGMKSAHRLGLTHGSLNPNNIVFDEDHCVHIIDFCSNDFQSKMKVQEGMGVVRREEERQNAKRADVFSFTSLMFNILIGDDVVSRSLPYEENENQIMHTGDLPRIPEFIPTFVEELIENGWSLDRSMRYSFKHLIEMMKENEFKFAAGVDSCEVFEFVNTVEISSF